MEKHIDKYGYEYGTDRQWRAVEYIERFLDEDLVKYTGDCYPDLLNFLSKYLNKAKRAERDFRLDYLDWYDLQDM